MVIMLLCTYEADAMLHLTAFGQLGDNPKREEEPGVA